MELSFLSRLFEGSKEEQKIRTIPGKPVGKFRVESVLRVFTRQVLIGEVTEGIVYPGCKLRGGSIGKVVKIEMGRRQVDLAESGNKVAIMLENEIPAKKGDELEIYP
ncbi:tRNA-binding protein Pbp11 [Thermococcus sp.]|uniref:tRNA-binding protein Pbp11 n=1 Tax=Thermococcus sp. TaxID=35749 RepID=UPI0025D9335F|nr:tRNA-binding protein Pbp11 [Thermococcus sp.]